MTVDWRNANPLDCLDINISFEKHVTIIDSIIARVKLLNQEIANDPLSNVSVIESNPTFITTKKTLLQLASVSSVVPYVIASFVRLLDDLNRKDNNAYIKKRPESSLNQIYVISLLLSDFTEANWSLKERSELSSLSSRSTEDSDKEYPHRIPANPLEDSLVIGALRVLVKLKSFKKARSIIRQLDGSSAYFELTSSNQTIADVDYNIEAVVRYLSSASPRGFSKTTEVAVANNAEITNGDILGYLEYLAFLNLNSANFEKELQLLLYFTDSFKNAYIQHIHSSFFIDAVVNYAVCNTKDFLEVITRPAIHKIGDTYFEKIFAKYKFAMENEKKFYLKALACALVIMPKQFEVFTTNLDTNKSKLLKNTSANKKQKLLYQVTRNIYDGTEKIPTLEFFMVLFNIASVIMQYEPQHPLVTVAKGYVLQVYHVLNPENNKAMMADTDISAVDKIRIEFYSLAIVLAPDLIKPKVINIIANPDTSLQFYFIITHAIKNLARRPYHKEAAYKLIDTIAITLRDHCGKLAKIVHETVADYDNIMSDSSSSSHSLRYSSSYASDNKTILSSKYSSTTLGINSNSHNSINNSNSNANSNNNTGLNQSTSAGGAGGSAGGYSTIPIVSGSFSGVSSTVGYGSNSGNNGNSTTNSSSNNTLPINSGTHSSVPPTPNSATSSSSNLPSSAGSGYEGLNTSSRENLNSFYGSSLDRNLSKVMKEKTKSKKEAAVSFFSSFREKRTASDSKHLNINTQPAMPNIAAPLNPSSAGQNSDRVSINSISASHMAARGKPIHILNLEYMKRVENNAFLSREILKLIFQIFRSYSSFFFKLPSIYAANNFADKSLTPVAEAARKTKTTLFELKRILDPLLISMADNDLKLVERARRLVLKILDVDDSSLTDMYIAFFSSCYLQSGFVDISLTYPLYDKKFLEIISFITLFWSKRSEILYLIDVDELYEHLGMEGFELVQKCLNDSEKLVLISLTTPGTDFYRLLKLICSLFVKDLDLDSQFHGQLKQSVNYNVFKAFADETYFVSSQVALQKRVRKKLYQSIDVYSEGLLQAIDITYERWREFYSIRNPSQQEEVEHRNYAGFLAVVLGGILNPKHAEIADSSRVKNLETFISKQSAHLSSEEVHEREGAKDLFANELHPHAHYIVIRNIQKDLDVMIKRKEMVESQNKGLVFDDGASAVAAVYLSSREITLIDSYLSILIGFLNFGEEDVNFANSADLRSIVTKLTLLLEKSKENVNINFLRLKMKACKYLQKLAENFDLLIIRGCAGKWKNNLIRTVTIWLDNVVFSNEAAAANGNYNLFSLSDGTRANSRREMDAFIFYELALECLKAISLLFKETSIYPFGIQYQSEVFIVRSTTFRNYFNLFSRILENCLAKTPSSSTLSAVERKVELIKDEVILAISNMLEFNYDVGLEIALPLSFHLDLKVKHAFLIVFNNIIETVQQANTKTTPEAKAKAYQEFSLHFGTNADGIIAVIRGILLQDYDVLSYNLLQILLSINNEIPMITELVDYELEVSPKAIDILRRNSVPAKLLSLYAKHIGTDYLISLLRPVIEEMISKKDFFEVEKLVNDDDLDVEQNVDKFFYYLSKIISNICTSIDTIPIELKALCSNIRQLVLKKTQDDSIAMLVISSFLFLRFICPAIVSPESENIIFNTPTKQEKRAYIQLAKMFQNLANDSIPSIRWPLLIEKKQQLANMKDQLFDFVDAVSKETVVQVPPKPHFVIDESAFSAVYSLLIHRNEEIGHFMMHPGFKPKTTIQQSIDSMHVIERISIDVGKEHLIFSPSIPEIVRNSRDSNPELSELFLRYKDFKDKELIESPFLTQSFMKDGTSLIVLSVQYFQRLLHYDLDLLIYRTVQIIHRKWGEPFKALVDCSFFDERCLVKLNKYYEIMNVLCRDYWKECIAFSFYNVSPSYFNYIKMGVDSSSLGPAGYTLKLFRSFYSPFDNIETLEAQGIPRWSLDVIKDTQLTIDCLVYSDDLKKYIPVVIKIGTFYIFWSSIIHKIEIEGKSKNIRITNTSKVSDWTDVTENDFINKDGKEFQVTVRGHGVLHFSSSKKSDIIKSLFLARLSYKADAVKRYIPIYYRKQVSTDSFLGSILASILLNLVSADASVRNVAFSSLVTIVDYYKLKLDRNIVADGSSFPKDFVPYVLDLCNSLSVNHPELTSDFISALSDGYETSESKYCCLMLLSLWIKNIYSQCYKSSEANSMEKVETIIHQFVKRIPPVNSPLILSFKTFIWKGILSDVNLVEFAVLDAIREALKKEIQGENWDHIHSVLSYFPSIDVCGIIIKQLRQIVDIPFFQNNRQVSINISWIKAKILVRVCEALSFDALFLAETYFAEICFIVSMLLNTGPSDMRLSVRNLIINVFYSFLSKENLSDAVRQHVLKTIDDFSGPGSKVTFGLIKSKNENYSVLPRRADQISGTVTHLENFCYTLLNFIELQPMEVRSLWKGRWSSYALSAAFRQYGPLQGRGILVAGIICKTGISDSVIIEFMRKYIEWCTGDLLAADFMVCICFFFAFANIAEGVTKISQYSGFLFCCGFTQCLFDNSVFFSTSLKILRCTITGMVLNGTLDDDTDILEKISSYRDEFSDYMDFVEGSFGISTTSDVVDQVFILYAIKALQLPFLKKNGLELLMLMFNVRVRYDLKQFKTTSPVANDELKFQSNAIGYLALIYVSGFHDASYKDILESCGLDSSRIRNVVGVDIPEILIDYFATQSDNATLTMYQAASYFCDKNTDATSKLNFLLLLNTLFDLAPDLVFYAYLIIKDTLMHEVESTGSIDMLQAAYKVIEVSSKNPDFETPEKFLERKDELFEKYHVQSIKLTGFQEADPLSIEEAVRLANHPFNPRILKFFYEKANAYTRVD